MSKRDTSRILVRNTRPEDFDQITALCQRVYPGSPAWGASALASHLEVFPRGQIVAEDLETQQIVGMAASLIIRWDDYKISGTWREFTGGGTFRNHDPVHGRTLYGAEVMVDPQMQGHGIGKKIYAERRNICRELKLLRIRAGARLRWYHRFSDRMSAEEYVVKLVNREQGDPTLTFQLKQGFRVIAVVQGYLPYDPESEGWAAVIEWINHQVAQRQDYKGRDPRFGKRRHSPGDEPDRPAQGDQPHSTQRSHESRPGRGAS